MQSPTHPAAQAAFIPTMRELVRSYQAFSTCSETHLRKLDLTPAQFDVIATLGNTQGLTMGELGEKTLITKGTLTGVIDRLEKKQIVQRQVLLDDRRSVVVKLTSTGEKLFEQVFPAHIAHLQERFEQLETSELELLRVLLVRLRHVF
ncbi:MarR family winged helix-turn-helix transcriptional regulator [Leptolyngbya ohadii]|uniref:MarR family winged helix-turn-helix transcriptional regulator n=1 Tax=Leptolyngbya ohadii TaxID=1962290 RepID=UPI000B59F790|nr:MarR family transcriptional regulator [Leptolyngbya ohadii]